MTDFMPVWSGKQVAEVSRLAREIWQEHYVPIIGQAQVDYMLEKFQSESAIADQLEGGYEYFLIQPHDQSAGYVAIVPDVSNATLLLSKIYVLKAARGQGLAKGALAFVEDLCRQRGLTTIWLTVNRHNAQSIGWYSRMGFVNVGPITQDIGGGFVMDDFRMEKSTARGGG